MIASVGTSGSSLIKDERRLAVLRAATPMTPSPNSEGSFFFFFSVCLSCANCKRREFLLSETGKGGRDLTGATVVVPSNGRLVSLLASDEGGGDQRQSPSQAIPPSKVPEGVLGRLKKGKLLRDCCCCCCWEWVMEGATQEEEGGGEKAEGRGEANGRIERVQEG